MAGTRLSIRQIFGAAAGAIVVVGASSFAGGMVGYHFGKADGQTTAQQLQSASVAGELGSLTLPAPMPFGNEVPREFTTPQAFLGVRFESIDASLAQKESLPVTEGAIVREIVEPGPAQAAGVQVGDIITAISGDAVNADHTLRDRVAAHKPGDTIDLTIRRGAETLTISLTLGERQGADAQEYEFRLPDDGSIPFFSEPSPCPPQGQQG